jgi:hypothetical protein
MMGGAATHPEAEDHIYVGGKGDGLQRDVDTCSIAPLVSARPKMTNPVRRRAGCT